MFHLIHAHTIGSFTRTENNNFNPDFRARNNCKTRRNLACAITEILMLVGVGMKHYIKKKSPKLCLTQNYSYLFILRPNSL